jgi:hypothetical protein
MVEPHALINCASKREGGGASCCAACSNGEVFRTGEPLWGGGPGPYVGGWCCKASIFPMIAKSIDSSQIALIRHPPHLRSLLPVEPLSAGLISTIAHAQKESLYRVPHARASHAQPWPTFHAARGSEERRHGGHAVVTPSTSTCTHTAAEMSNNCAITHSTPPSQRFPAAVSTVEVPAKFPTRTCDCNRSVIIQESYTDFRIRALIRARLSDRANSASAPPLRMRPFIVKRTGPFGLAAWLTNRKPRPSNYLKKRCLVRCASAVCAPRRLSIKRPARPRRLLRGRRGHGASTLEAGARPG